MIAAEAYGDGAITEVIRPAAILPEDAARAVVSELMLRDARLGGTWVADPSSWRRYDRAWDGAHDSEGTAQLLGNMQVIYGTPTRYEITIFRATITPYGAEQGWSVERLCDEALGFGGLTLADCPRASMAAPPPVFRG